MNSETIVVTKVDQVIPNDFVQLLLDKHKTSVAVAVIEDAANMKIATAHSPSDEYELASVIEEVQKKFKDRRYLLHFANFPDNDQNPADNQPYTLVEEDGQPIAVAFLEGDFSDFADDKSGHSPAWHVANDLLKGEFEKLYAAADEDPDKFVELAQEPKFRESLLPLLSPRGVIAVLPCVGEPLIYANNDQALTADWGYSSRKLGYGEKAEMPAGGTKEQSLAEKIAARKAAKAAEAEPKRIQNPVGAGTTTATKAKITTVPTVQPKAEKTNTRIPSTTEQLIHPPKELYGKALKQWYNRNRVAGPDGKHWSQKDLDERTPIPESQLKPDSDMKTGIDTLKKMKDAPIIPHVDLKTDVPPIVFPSQLKELQDKFFLRNDLMHDPTTLQAQESKFPPLTDQTKKPLEYYLGMTFKAKRDLCREYPQAGACLINELCFSLLKARPDLMQKILKPVEAKTTDVKEQSLAEKIAAKKAAKAG